MFKDENDDASPLMGQEIAKYTAPKDRGSDATSLLNAFNGKKQDGSTLGGTAAAEDGGDDIDYGAIASSILSGD